MSKFRAIAAKPTTRSTDSAMTRLLSHHFGDRSLYLLDEEDRELYPQAIALGLVSEEGYLTHRGYQLWQHAEA